MTRRPPKLPPMPAPLVLGSATVASIYKHTDSASLYSIRVEWFLMPWDGAITLARWLDDAAAWIKEAERADQT